MIKRKKTLINWLGLLGIISLLSYTAAVVFSPLAYPGYDWKSQAVSDLSAANSPSLALWTKLNSLYGLCGVICMMMICVFIQGKLNKPVRLGIYFFTAMNWISVVGYTLFPLSFPMSDSQFEGGGQDVMHLVVTGLVVIFSILSLVLIMIGGYRKKQYISLAVWASVTLAAMFVAAIGTQAAPEEIFGIFERFSVFAASGFNAVLGIFLFTGKINDERRNTINEKNH